MLSLRNFRMPRPAAVGLALAIAMVSVPTVGVTIASANTAPNNAVMGGFELDGNLYPGYDNSVINGSYASGADMDWSAVGAPVAQDPIGTADTTVFSNGSKDANPAGWALNGSAGAANKADIGNVYYAGRVQKVGGVNHLFAFFGFERASNNGTVQYIAELNAKPNVINAQGVSVPNRVKGDIELLITQNGNSPLVLQETANQWDGSKWVPLTPQPWLVGYGNDTNIPSLVGKWSGVNDPIAVPGGPSGYQIPQYQFAEVGVDLTGLLGLSNSCDANYLGFSELNVRSQSSTSSGPELKDYVNPIGINIPPDCSQITIKKVTNPNTDTTTQFPFTTDLTGSIDSSSNVAAGTSPTSFSLVNGGAMIDRTVVPNQTYNISEGTQPTNWGFDNVVCKDDTTGATIASSSTSGSVSVTPTNYQGITCTYTNKFLLITAQPLTVSASATPSFSRNYTWNINKTVDGKKSELFQAPSGTSVSANYSVVVDVAGHTDSKWAISGNVTVNNPNAFAVNNVVVSLPAASQTFLGGSCALTGPTTVTVPASGHTDVPYSCTYSVAPSPSSGTFTGNASWPALQFPYTWSTTSASGGTAVNFASVVPTVTNGQVTVVDSIHGSLGTVTVAQAPKTFTYSVGFTAPSGTCADHPNTATFTTDTDGVQGSSSADVQVCGGSNLTINKTANPAFSRTYLWQITKVVDHTKVTIANGGTGTFNYTVTATQTGVSDAGWTVTGNITVTNPNDWEAVTLTTLTDATTIGGSCTLNTAGPYVVPKSGSITVGYTCTYGTQPISYSGQNTATATWDAATYATAAGSASVNVPFAFDPASTTGVTLTNKTIHVTDSYAGALGTVTATDPPAAAAVGTFTYSRTESGVGGTCTTYDNTATITETKQNASQSVQLCVGKDLTVTKTASGNFDRTYLWQITKNVDNTKVYIASGGSATFNYTVTANQTGFTDSNWTTAGTITVSNPNDFEAITLTGLSDVLNNGGTCAVTESAPYVIPASGSLTLHYTCNYASKPSTYNATNTATATWSASANHTPTGSASGSANFTLTQAGSTNKTIHVTDPVGGGALGTVTATDSAPYASGTFNYSRTVSGVAGTCTNYDNTATITETGQSASKTVTLCVGLDLTVSKTAAGHFDRTYLWQIAKDVDQTRVTIASGGSAAFHYRVTASQTGFTDSNWTTAGTITISNPNDFEAITLTGLSDVLNNGGSCSVTESAPYVIPASGSLTLHYTCSYSGQPSSYNATNTATATWNASTNHTPTGSASGSANFTLTQLGSTNKTIHVTDTYAGALGTVTATDSVPYATQDFTYERTESGIGGTCTNYDNTATITETKQSASKTVTVCTGLDLTVAKTANPAFARQYLWDINKAVDKTTVNVAAGGTATFNYTVTATQTGVSDAGWTVTGNITVHNPNDFEAITLTDLQDVTTIGGTCTLNTAGPYVVPKSGDLVVGYSCTYGTTPVAYSGTNTATASWDKAAYATPTGSASGSANFVFDPASTAGVTLLNKTIHVTDTYAGDLGTVTATDPPAAAAVGTFTYSRTESGVGGTCTKYDNTATITETKQSDSKTVTVCVGQDLTVAKTANTSYTRTFAWTINKNVDKSAFVVDAFGNATANYTVTVSHDAGTDSAWLVTGNITVSNPNDWEAITANVADAIDNGGSCNVVGGSDVVIPANGSVTLSYSCTYASAPTSLEGTNTATATWDKGAAATPDGSANGTAGYAFGAPTTVVDDSVDVTDTYAGDLGTVNVTDETNPTDFTYSRTFTAGAPGTCATYPNTASFVTNTTETTGSASASVSVCSPVVVKHVTQITDSGGTVQGSVTDPVKGPWLDGSKVFAGDLVQYSILVNNPGTVDATTTLTENIPANTTYAGGDNVTWTGCTIGDAGTGPCTTTVTVPAGTTQAYTFTVRVNFGLAADVSQITNTVLSPNCTAQAVLPDVKAAAVVDPCTVTDPRVPSSLQVLKEDVITTTPLAGATFQLWLGTKLSGDTVVDTGTAVGKPCTTDATGLCAVSNLEPGTYYWQETAAPAGYVLPTGAAAFTAAVEQPSRANAGNELTVTKVEDISIPITGCASNPAACVLKVKKIDAGTGAVLAGAEFALYLGTDPTAVGTCTTGSNGICSVEYTQTGTYTWVEVKAPAGYALPTNVKVGTVVVNDTNIGTDIPALVVKDGQLPHTGLDFPVGQVFGWSLASVLLGLFLLAMSRRRRTN